MIFGAFTMLAACRGGGGADDATTQACERWDAIQGTQTGDAEAAAELNEIARLATSSPVREKARALADALEGDETQAAVGTAYEEMDAACIAATN